MITFNQIIQLENVHCYIGNDNIIYYLIDDIAKELGFYQEKEYKNLPLYSL